MTITQYFCGDNLLDFCQGKKYEKNKQTNKQTSKTLVSHEDIIKKVLDYLLANTIFYFCRRRLLSLIKGKMKLLSLLLHFIQLDSKIIVHN